MKEDPILKEIHDTRKRLLEESGGNMQKLMDRLKFLEAEERDRVISHDQVKTRLASKTPR
ncbi:MAG: hypothetical protein ACRD1X_18565 [Vicinamibacteria bacterium]